MLTDPESLVAPHQVVDIFEYCNQAFNDPLFGLHLSTTEERKVFCCVTEVCHSAPTVRAGIRCLIDYLLVVHAPDCEVLLI